MTNQFPVVPAQSQRVRDRPDIHGLLLLISASWRVIVAFVLASLAAAWLFTKISTPLFTAQSSLLVDSNKGQLSRTHDENSNFGVEIAEIETQLQILKSQKIALLVVDRLGLDRDPVFMGEVAPNPSNWLNSLLWSLLPALGTVPSEGGPDRRHRAAMRFADAMNVARIGASYVVLVSVSTSNPLRAAEIANALTEVYVTDRIEARLEAAQRTNLEQERQRELRMRILSSATPPLSPSGPRRRVILGVAAIFGAFLGLGIAFLRRAMDDTVKLPEQVTSTGARLLGVIPATRFVEGDFRQGEKTPSIFQYARLNPLSPFARNMRKIKSAVQIANTRPKRGFCLGIVSTMPGEGKSTVAGNLADLVGASGRRTLLLNVDFHALDCNDAQGHGTAPNYTFLDSAKLRNLLAPSEGQQPLSCDFSVGAGDLLGSEQMDQFLSQCRRDYEYVLLDCPPAELLPDPMVVTHRLDALIVVAEWGRLPFDVFATGLSSLGAGSSKILGVVLNKVGSRAIEVNRSSASLIISKFIGRLKLPIISKFIGRLKLPIISKFIGRLKLLWSGAEWRLEKE
jgi:succinoglycan biosynthesis transport protein ExoP